MTEQNRLFAGLMRLIRGPYAVLAVAELVVLTFEYVRGSDPARTWLVWPLLQAVVAASALVVVWRRQNELTLIPVVVFGVAFQLAWIGVHLARDVLSDYDSGEVYAVQGNALLHGTYPASEYPPGAVLLFALDALLGRGETRISHAFVMVPFQLLIILAIGSLRTRWSMWFAVVAAAWPLNAFFTEFKFDSVPAALLVLGLLLAHRERWALSGAVLGVGTAVKWMPALTVAALGLWLLTTRRRREALLHVAAAGIVFVAINTPFLVWSPHEVLNAYITQGSRGIIGESLPYIPLNGLGLAHVNGFLWDEAVVPGWANAAAIALQGLAILVVFAALVRIRKNPRAALSIATMAPLVFLIFNRVFSPQFLLVFVAGWLMAGSLLARTPGDQLLFGSFVWCSTLANTLVYPTVPSFWIVFSAILFASALTATAWVFVRAGAFSSFARHGDRSGPTRAKRQRGGASTGSST